MRILIAGKSVCANALRDRCRHARFAVVDTDTIFDYKVTIEEDPKVNMIGIDGAKGRVRDLEDFVETMIGERLREMNLDISIVKFPVGGVTAANEVIITIPPRLPEVERAVEIGCVNALGWLVRHEDEKAQAVVVPPPPAEPKPEPKVKARSKAAGFLSWLS